MKHSRSTETGRDEGRLSTFVLDVCFPSQGSEQGIKETTNQRDQHVHGSESTRQRILPHGSGRLSARMRVRQRHTRERSRTVNRRSPRSGDRATQFSRTRRTAAVSQIAAESAVRGAEGMIRTWKMSAEEQLKAAASVDCDGRRRNHQEIQCGSSPQDGTSENSEQEIRQQEAAVRRESRADDAEGQSHKDQTGVDSSVRSVCR